MKEKIAFALVMGIITTGVISFILISVNIGWPLRYLSIWLRSWSLAYLLVVPIILVVGPQVARFVQWIFRNRKVVSSKHTDS